MISYPRLIVAIIALFLRFLDIHDGNYSGSGRFGHFRWPYGQINHWVDDGVFC